jgi:hypothetical protein
MILENAIENYLTAKPLRTQYPVGALRTYSKIKIHPFGEDIDDLSFYSKPCFSLASLRLCGGILNLTADFRMISVQKVPSYV